jgi:hypothetical protein
VSKKILEAVLATMTAEKQKELQKRVKAEVMGGDFLFKGFQDQI